MHCFQHRTQMATGICKYCGKAVCPDCVKDTGHGLACSDSCAVEVDANHEVMQRTKQIYSIGKKSRLPTTGVLFYLVFGLLFAGFGLSPTLYGANVEWFTTAMGSAFVAFGVIAYFRTRKLQINC